MAIALDGSTPVVTTGTTSPLTSASFNPPAGSYLLVTLVDMSTGGVKTFVPSSSGLSFTRRTTNATEAVEQWTAPCPSTGARTVACSSSGSVFGWSMTVQVWTGCDTTTIGTVNNGGTSTTNDLVAAAITTSVNNSRVVGAAGDDSGASAGGLYTSTDSSAVGQDGIVAYKAANTPTSGTAVTLDFNAGGAGVVAHRWVALELKPSTATVIQVPQTLIFQAQALDQSYTW